MNGAKSTFMRTGYWLTALAAAVLLAASPGTAQAQIVPDTEYDTDGFKVDGLGKTINEGDATVIQVSLRAMVEAGTNPTAVTVKVAIVASAPETPNDLTNDADDGDVTLTGQDEFNEVEVTLNFPGGVADADPVTYTRTANVYLGTGQDGDAEDEKFAVRFTLANARGVTQPNMEVTIDDDETQTYVLTLGTKDPKEGTNFDVILKADPAHDDGSAILTLHLSDPKYTIPGGTITVNSLDATDGDTITVTPPGGPQATETESRTL